MAIIKTEKLVFEYTRHSEENEKGVCFLALDDVSLSIEKGDFVAILGHNGSGKSTLAKHFNALLIPTSGKVLVNGLDTADEQNTFNIRKTAGMVFQNPDNQIVATIVEEDVAFGPENLGIIPSEIVSRVEQSLGMVDMLDFAKSAPDFLSGGQKQRIAIAGVLAMRPQCIVLDEPTAMLDPIGRKEVLDAVTRLNREEGITVILITHFMEEAVCADKVIVMKDGKALMSGTPKEVFSNQRETRAAGLCLPQITELCLSLRSKGIDIPNDILTIDEMVDALCRLK